MSRLVAACTQIAVHRGADLSYICFIPCFSNFEPVCVDFLQTFSKFSKHISNSVTVFMSIISKLDSVLEKRTHVTVFDQFEQQIESSQLR